VPCVTNWQYPLTDGYLVLPSTASTTRRVHESCSKLYLSFRAVNKFNMFYVKPAGNAVKYDESLRKVA
jgi:hypothetical protein